jgi:hypothetical protein
MIKSVSQSQSEYASKVHMRGQSDPDSGLIKTPRRPRSELRDLACWFCVLFRLNKLNGGSIIIGPIATSDIKPACFMFACFCCCWFAEHTGCFNARARAVKYLKTKNTKRKPKWHDGPASSLQQHQASLSFCLMWMLGYLFLLLVCLIAITLFLTCAHAHAGL